MKKRSLSSVILCLLLLAPAWCAGQEGATGERKTDGPPVIQPSQDPGGYVLELSHAKRAKVKMIRPGKKIKVWAEGEEVRKRVDSITRDSIYLGGYAFSVSEVDKIRVRLKGFMHAGGTTIAVGSAGCILGMIIVAGSFAGTDSEDAGEQFVGILVGMMGVGLFMAGSGLVLVGIPMLFIGKKYDMHKKWHLRSVFVPDKLYSFQTR